MTVLVGAAVLIIIAAAVFLFALGVLRRQVGREPGTAAEPVSQAVSSGPAQQFIADRPGMAHHLMTDGMQHSNPGDLGDLNIAGQWVRTTHQFDSDQSDPIGQDAMAFATEPLQTERMPQFSTPNAMQVPSTPVPQQQAIPSTPTTPTNFWEMATGEIVTDPLLEAMMHQAQAGLYVIPEREDRLEA